MVPKRPGVRPIPALAALAPLLALLANALPAQLWEARDQLLRQAETTAYTGSRYGAALSSGDFNADGFSDLVIGCPGFQSGNGGTARFRGTAADHLAFVSSVSGLDPDRAGTAVAWGDFDGDGDTELAEGRPGWSAGGVAEGRVLIYSGSGDSIFYLGGFSQSDAGVPGAPEEGDEFGAALASGDWNGDGADDLAIGVPGEDVGSTLNAGAVVLLYGTPGVGLTTAGASIWHLDVSGIAGVAAEYDRLGDVLTAYNRDCDAADEVAIGIPGRTVAGETGAGAVLILQGAPGGVGSAGSELLDESALVLLGGAPELGERFGAALAPARNFDTGCSGLFIGAPGEKVGAVGAAGAVYRWTGNVATSTRWTAADLSTVVESGDRLGGALASGDFDRDGSWDVAIGSPGEVTALLALGGIVHVVHSNLGNPDPANAYRITPRPGFGIFEIAEGGDGFGAALAAGDWNGDGYADLAIGAPQTEVSGRLDAGAVQVVFGALFAADFEDDDLDEWSSATP